MPLLIGTPPAVSNVTQFGSLAVGSAVMLTGRKTLSSLASSLIVASNANRRFVAVLNNSGQTIYMGSSASTTTMNGFEVPSGVTVNFSRSVEQYTGPIWGITLSSTSSTSLVTFMEV